MNTSSLTRRSFALRAFTLIELLVVITIIAVLAGLLLPVAGKVMENARKVSAKSTETQIVSAINSYQTEYGQYPVAVTAGAPPKDTTFGTDACANKSNKPLFDVLRALNVVDPATNVLLNSRRIVYFESKNVKSATNPRDGFIASGTPTGNPKSNKPPSLVVGDLVDPWGNYYAVRIDTGYSNAVSNPYKGASGDADDDDGTGATAPTANDQKDQLRTGVISWSYGDDGYKGKGGANVPQPYTAIGDDVDSWQ